MASALERSNTGIAKNFCINWNAWFYLFIVLSGKYKDQRKYLKKISKDSLEDWVW